MLKSRCIFSLLFLFSGLTAISQKNKEAFFAFREDWSPINNINIATYFMHRVKENDTTYVCRFYRTLGPMVKSETYKDENLEIPHGRFTWYNQLGNIDSNGMVYNGKKDGYWEFRKPTGEMAMSILFDKGKRVWTKNFISNTTSFADGRIEDHTAKNNRDSITEATIEVDQRPAEFRGGVQGWLRYLEKNLRTPERFKNVVGSGGMGKVIVSFTIDKEGRVYDAYIDHSVEWSVDMETIRVLRESPRWTPAHQNGKPVHYRHKQSITHTVTTL